MSSIQGVNHNLWNTATSASTSSVNKMDDVAEQFKKTLAGETNSSKSQGQGGSDEETTTTIQRSVITADDGSQIVVLTQITVDSSGKQIESKVISKQKISTGNDKQSQHGSNPFNIGKSQDKYDDKTTLNAMTERARKEYEDNSVINSSQLENIFKANI